MQRLSSRSLVDRMVGAARLDAAIYEDVERDQDATQQALIVVALAAIAGAIGSIGDGGAGGIILGLISAILGWIIFSALAYFVGTRLVPARETSATLGELLRTLGFAQTPNILAVVGFIPVLGPLAALVAAVWTLVASIVAIRQALEMSTGRAIAVALLSVLVWVIIVTIIAAVFGVGFALAG